MLTPFQGQLRNNGVGMDGFIISKCDTVGDMVGTLVSMVHATGIPVVFLGVGQHYGDLRGSERRLGRRQVDEVVTLQFHFSSNSSLENSSVARLFYSLL